MKYYSILLPVSTLLPDIVYSSDSDITNGARVIVSFNRRIITGICDCEYDSNLLKPKVRYKKVIEILDTNSILPLSLLDLAKWMSKYYKCSLCKTVFSMLPSVVMPEIASQIRWIYEKETPDEFIQLYFLLTDNKFHQIKDLRKSFNNKPFYKLMEQAEKEGVIEVKREYDNKIKPKTENYIRVKDNEGVTDLTPKQSAAWQLIKSLGNEFALKSITEEISYSIIKALVKKTLIEIVPRQVDQKAVIFPEQKTIKNIILSPEQKNVIQSVLDCYHEPKVHLIYGITGSGKTEVYIEVIKFYLNQGQNVIMLIPEIALTPQMVDRFYSAFDSMIAILHSHLTERQRFEQWLDIKNGKCHIVIGARSAIFAPMQNIGLIIIDEEHESSYKQENTPRYNGRDVAIVRAKMAKAAVILGSATPSLESWNNADQGRFQKHILSKRPTPQGLPDVQLIDLRDEQDFELLSYTLRTEIQNCLDNKEQVILLQNRRGYASFVQCKNCGILEKCPNCEISYYYHYDKDELLCHYCGYHLPIPRKCSACGSYTFSFGAPGTQKIEQLLKIYFPSAMILRLDSDSAARKDAYTLMYDKMHRHDIDILLGTQMISKGLDFPNVTLVGVILADISLSIPDFRAAERTFNILTQVAGRSGRGEKPGKVIIQTWNPEHYAIKYACQQDYDSFAEEELQYRKRLNYPPFYRLGRFIFTAKDEKRLRSELNRYHTSLEKLNETYGSPPLYILGPGPAPIVKLNNLYRYHLICKAIDAETLSKAITDIDKILKLHSSISVVIDIDPISLM